MTLYNGRLSAIDGIGQVGSWQITETTEEDKSINSATKGGTDRTFGTKDTTGSISCEGTLPPMLPGEIFTFSGYISSTDGTVGGDGMIFEVESMCTQLQVVWDYDANKIVRYTAQFGGMGAFTITSGTAIVDASTNCKVKASTCTMVYGSGPTPLAPTRTTVTLTMTNAVTVRSDASTAGWKTRESGTLDWNLAVVVNGGNPAHAIGDYIENLKLKVNGTDYFWFEDAIFGQVTDVTVAPGTETIVTHTLNLHMAAAGADCAVGFIRIPGDAVNNFWPSPDAP